MSITATIKGWFARKPQPKEVEIPAQWFEKTLGKQLVQQLRWLREEIKKDREFAGFIRDCDMSPVDKMNMIDATNYRIEMLTSIENDLIMNSHFNDDLKDELNAPESKRNFMMVVAFVLSAVVMAVSMVYMLLYIFHAVKCQCA